MSDPLTLPPYMKHLVAPALRPCADDEINPNVFLADSACRVELRDGKVVKFGRRVTVCEEAALDYAGKLELRAPRLLDGDPPRDGCPYIWMDYVEGDCLQDVWPTMSEDQKEKIAKDLGQIIYWMRHYESEDGTVRYIEPPEKLGDGRYGVVRDLLTYKSRTGYNCRDEASFNEFLLAGLHKSAPLAKRQELTNRLRTDHRICFTHGDLFTRNIIVKDNEIQALIDWEYGGWYPEYWEYAKFWYGHDRHGDWKDYAHFIFPEEYANEYKQDLEDYREVRYWQD